MPSRRFVSVGLLTQRDLDVLGSGFRRAFPLNDTQDYTALLVEIDQVDQNRIRWTVDPPRFQ
jgi:hypothetical protein